MLPTLCIARLIGQRWSTAAAHTGLKAVGQQLLAAVNILNAGTSRAIADIARAMSGLEPARSRNTCPSGGRALDLALFLAPVLGQIPDLCPSLNKSRDSAPQTTTLKLEQSSFVEGKIKIHALAQQADPKQQGAYVIIVVES